MQVTVLSSTTSGNEPVAAGQWSYGGNVVFLQRVNETTSVLFYSSKQIPSRLMMQGLMDFCIKVSRITSFMLSTGTCGCRGIHRPLSVPSLSEKERKCYNGLTRIDFANTPNIPEHFLASKPQMFYFSDCQHRIKNCSNISDKAIELDGVTCY